MTREAVARLRREYGQARNQQRTVSRQTGNGAGI